MRFLPTRIHGMIDYLTGALLIALPWLVGFADGGVAQWLPVFLGAGAILYSILTDYELGLARALPMPAHLVLDAMSGLLFIVSPWLFGLEGTPAWLFPALGLFEVAVSLVTQTEPMPEPAAQAARAR